jgi:hypothetical protein
MPGSTTNYSWNLPTVGGDEDAWGGYLNSNWSDLDTLLGGTNSTEFAILDGATVTTAELNLLDGVTWTLTDFNGLTSTVAELNILDGATVTVAEVNILDGDTSATATTLVDADRLVANDDGTMVQIAMTDVRDYLLIDEDDMASDSATKLPSQQSVKAFVEGFGSPTLSTDGAANLPGGLQIRWGVETSDSDNNESFTFASAFSNACFIVQVEFETSKRGASIEAKSTTGFTINRDGGIDGTNTFNYFAIGW